LIRITAKVADRSARACRYLLAGTPVAIQNEVPVLSAYADGYATERFSEILANAVAPALLNAANSSLQYHGNAPIGGSEQEIRYWRSGHRGQVDIGGEAACQINFQESHIHVCNNESINSEANVDLITGPALILLLSQLNIYCLHAGGVATRVGNIGFIAESGVGKSTLSKDFDKDWRQISDDILPIHFDPDNGSVEMLPAYPQLKLQDATMANGVPQPRHLDYLIRVIPEPSEEISFKHLSKVKGMLQIVRHTVAAKLFDKSALVNHAKFAKKLSVAVPVVEISYPRKLDQIDELRESIVSFLEGSDLESFSE